MTRIRPIYTFERDGKFFAVDVQDTFCFECDKITSEVLQYYPENTQNKIVHILSEKYPEKELLEVINELEYLRSIGSILKHLKIETWAQSLTQGIYLNTLSFFIKEKDLSRIEKIISLTLQKALPYVQANQKFQMNLWFCPEHETFQENLDSLIELFKEEFPVKVKNLQINLYLSVPFHIKKKLKIEENERIFHVFPGTDPELIKNIKTIHEKEYFNFLNDNNGYTLFLPERIPFSTTVEKFFSHGAKKIILDPFAPLVFNPNIDMLQHFQELLNLTKTYTLQLKKGSRYVLEPLMQLFQNIQYGNPIQRRDPAGAQEWFVTPEGDIYGGYLYYTRNICKMGNILKDEIPSKEAQKLYHLGIKTTPACIHCWAKNFCGGGHGALHYQLTGKINKPSTNWCGRQRKWIEEVIVCYQELNNAGVPISSDYPVNTTTRPGRLIVLKHIFRSFFKEYISIRPLRPQDEEWLTHWENWNSNIYFTLKNENIQTTTHHEKEQEILNTAKDYEEWVLVDKKAKPRGLIRIQPYNNIPNLTIVYIYFHNPEDYLNKDIQENFQTIFSQIKNHYPENRWLIPVKPDDKSFIIFLEKLHFQKEGTFRDALFLHNQYYHIDIYTR